MTDEAQDQGDRVEQYAKKLVEKWREWYEPIICEMADGLGVGFGEARAAFVAMKADHLCAFMATWSNAQAQFAEMYADEAELRRAMMEFCKRQMDDIEDGEEWKGENDDEEPWKDPDA